MRCGQDGSADCDSSGSSLEFAAYEGKPDRADRQFMRFS